MAAAVQVLPQQNLYKPQVLRPEVHSGSGLLSALMLTSALSVLCLFIAIHYGFRDMDVSQGVFLSWFAATLSLIPTVIWLGLSIHNTSARILIAAWPLLRGAFLLVSPPADVALQIGDSKFIDQMARFFANYWLTGGEIIAPHSILLLQGATKYVGAPYIFALPYMAFGQDPYVVVPWLAAFQFVAAATSLPLMRLLRMDGKFAVLYLLYCPAWLYYTNNLYRDSFLMIGLILVPMGVLEILQGRRLVGAIATGLGATFILLMRQEYFILVLLLVLLPIALKPSFKRLALIAVILIGTISLQSALRVSDTPLLESLRNTVVTASSGELTLGTKSYMGRYANLDWKNLPVAVPIRIVAGVVSPFPWTNIEASFDDQYGWWVYAGFHFAEAIFHMGILIVIAMNWKRMWKSITRDEIVVASWGAILFLAGALSYVAFNRYVLIAFVFLIPLAIKASPRALFRHAVASGLLFMAVLHVMYYAFR